MDGKREAVKFPLEDLNEMTICNAWNNKYVFNFSREKEEQEQYIL